MNHVVDPVLVLLTVGIIIVVSLSAIAVGALSYYLFRAKSVAAQQEILIEAYKDALRRPAIAAFTPNQIQDLAHLLKDQTTKAWTN